METMKMKDTPMNAKHNIFGKIILGAGLSLALAAAAWLPGTARAADDGKMAHHGPLEMRQIKTQA